MSLPQLSTGISKSARCLAAEILQPEEVYRERFAHHEKRLRAEGVTNDLLVKETIRAVAKDFDVSLHSAANRARVLKFLTNRRYDELFPTIL